jgi:hypothetical protein
MANVANKYQNSKIYKLKCINPDISEEEYVGHTTQRYLSSRLVQHRDCAKYMKINRSKVYAVMNSTGVHNWQILLLENYPCTTSDEIKAREQYWIDLLHPTLNTNGAVFDVMKAKTTKQRHYVENKEKIIAYSKQYNEDHKDTKVAYMKEYMKEYRTRPEHKEKERVRFMTLTHCQCGQSYTKYHKKRHEQSNRHAIGLENQFNNEFQMLANIDITD